MLHVAPGTEQELDVPRSRPTSQLPPALPWEGDGSEREGGTDMLHRLGKMRIGMGISLNDLRLRSDGPLVKKGHRENN